MECGIGSEGISEDTTTTGGAGEVLSIEVEGLELELDLELDEELEEDELVLPPIIPLPLPLPPPLLLFDDELLFFSEP